MKKHKHDGKKMKEDKNSRCAHFEIQVKNWGTVKKFKKLELKISIGKKK